MWTIPSTQDHRMISCDHSFRQQ